MTDTTEQAPIDSITVGDDLSSVSIEELRDRFVALRDENQRAILDRDSALRMSARDAESLAEAGQAIEALQASMTALEASIETIGAEASARIVEAEAKAATQGDEALFHLYVSSAAQGFIACHTIVPNPADVAAYAFQVASAVMTLHSRVRAMNQRE